MGKAAHVCGRRIRVSENKIGGPGMAGRDQVGGGGGVRGPQGSWKAGGEGAGWAVFRCQLYRKLPLVCRPWEIEHNFV